MSIQSPSQYCLYCDKQVKGRSDKKFCGDNCRGLYNYALNCDVAVVMRKINITLRRNRKILQSFVPNPIASKEVEIDSLLSEGFSFLYHTHVQKDKAGNTLYYCYDVGYFLTLEQQVMILK
jgi:predicted nucleic acid-binding Zn ribbon protein